jgi:hypothetical protein
MFRTSEMFFDTMKPQFAQIPSLTKILLNREDDSLFVFDSQVIMPLEIVARKCRDPGLRESMRLMAGVKRRECFMDGLVMAKMCAWLVGIEEEGMLGRYVPEEARARNVRAEPAEKGGLRVWCEVARVGGRRSSSSMRSM